MAANVLAEQLERIQDGLQPPAVGSRGLVTRIAILCALAGVALLAALLQLFWLLLGYRRYGFKQSFWLFRYSSRYGERWICTNTKLISCLWAILCLVANLLYLTDAKNVFVDHGSETASGIWRAVLPMFVVLHLATVCAGQLQSYAVGHTSTSRPVLRARTCNIIFVTALATATLGLLIIAIIGSVSGAKMWQSWITVRNTAQPIVDPSAGFPPDFNPLTIEATLRRQFATFGMWATMYNRASTAMYASATAVVLIILILNLGAIVVALRARRKSNAEAREALPTDLTLTLVPSAGSDPSAAQKSSTISTAQKIANRHMHLHSIFGAKARQLAARQKAERDLLLMACWCAFISAMGSGFGLWVTSSPADPNDRVAFETALLYINYLYILLMIVIYPFLLRGAWQNLPPSSTPSRWRLPRFFRRRRHSPRMASSNVAPGAAPAGRVRVIVEERVREDIRMDYDASELDALGLGLETVIEGNVLLAPVIEDEGKEEGGEGTTKSTSWIKPSWATGGAPSPPHEAQTEEPRRFRLPRCSLTAARAKSADGQSGAGSSSSSRQP